MMHYLFNEMINQEDIAWMQNKNKNKDSLKKTIATSS